MKTRLKKSQLRTLIRQVISEQRGRAPMAPASPSMGMGGPGFGGQSREEKEEEKPKGRFWRFLAGLFNAAADGI
tara:strand:+ start:660 stop:881 length:222 start_codon:yes stop_codon:yes gene_type:complete